MELIRITGLKKYFSGEKVFEELSLSVVENEILVVMGESGAGKSTLLSLIAGLEKPDGGTIEYHPSIFEGIKVPLPMVFQETDTLLPWKTVRENIVLVNMQAQDSLVDSLLDSVRMKDHQDKYPYELSGGMKQRTGIARALICKSKLLLMDEPFASLDKEMRSDLQDLLLDIQKKYKLSIIFVTHDENEAEKIGDRIVRI